MATEHNADIHLNALQSPVSVTRVHREVPTYARLVPLPGDREATKPHLLLPLHVILWPL